MGSSVGASLRRAGCEVVWASQGRSDQTRARAEEAGLIDAGSLAGVAARSSAVVLSVCPPQAAAKLAHQLMATGFRGTFVDCNAIAPASAREIARVVEAAGAIYVDGGLIGPPARSAGSTRLYLSGARASQVASLFDGGPLEAIALDEGVATASALKMAFAAYTKGSTALLIAIRALARSEGVEAALLDEWAISQPTLAAASEGGARATARKAWRFEAEMHEIASSFAAAGLPDGFHRAAAEIYRRVAPLEQAADAPTLDDVLARVAGAGPVADDDR
jgi:3-hydroxyisobutyrate dehydrogenase-like beta-hydroxyacid dehydrogenase